MSVTIQIPPTVAPTGLLVRTRVTLPGGTSLAEFALAEETNAASEGMSIYSGSAAATIPDTGAVQLIAESRQVSAQTTVAYDASTTVRGVGPIGYVVGGALSILGPGELAAIGATIVSGGSGDTPVDHNTGGTDALRLMLAGQPVGSAIIRAYTLASWQSNRTTAQLLGSSLTGSDGRWASPIYLTAGSGGTNTIGYSIVFDRPGTIEAVESDIQI